MGLHTDPVMCGRARLTGLSSFCQPAYSHSGQGGCLHVQGTSPKLTKYSRCLPCPCFRPGAVPLQRPRPPARLQQCRQLTRQHVLTCSAGLLQALDSLLHPQRGQGDVISRQAPASPPHQCSFLGPPAVLLQTLKSLCTFKSAGIHCPSAYIITSLAMVFLELREQQAEREQQADSGDHLVNGSQRKASLTSPSGMLRYERLPPCTPGHLPCCSARQGLQPVRCCLTGWQAGSQPVGPCLLLHPAQMLS